MAHATLHITPHSEVFLTDDDAFESGFEQEMWETRRNPERVLFGRAYKEAMLDAIDRINRGGWK